MSKKDVFGASPQNVENQRISQTWGGHVAILDQNTWRLSSVWHQFFMICVNVLKSRKVFDFQLFSMVLDHKKSSFSDRVFIVFRVFSKPLTGTVFRESECRTFIKNCFGVPFPIFRIFKKAPFGPPFRPSRRQKTSPASHRTDPCRDPAFH